MQPCAVVAAFMFILLYVWMMITDYQIKKMDDRCTVIEYKLGIKS